MRRQEDSRPIHRDSAYTAGMAMGRRAKQRQPQADFWIAHTQLPRTVGHPFYERLNQLLEERGFDEFVESECGRFYAETMGRPSLTPGRYFRLLLIGYFEGIDGERGIAWRAADSLALRRFLELELSEPPPDHSTISRTRRLIDVETHQAVFRWVLELLAEKGLLKGKTVGVDATTLEANAAMRSIVRRDTGEGYEEFLRRLAQASGIATPTREQLAKLDRKRTKKGSNDDWVNPHDPEAGITKMKDGRTHLAWHLSRKLCLRDSCRDLEAGLKHGIELVKYTSDIASQALPLTLLERRDGEAELELERVLGVEVPTTVTSHDFQLAINGLDDIGGGQRTTNGFWIVEKGQVVQAFLA